MKRNKQGYMTPAQSEVYRRMEIGVKYSSYGLGVSLSTMQALFKKGLVNKHAVVGHIYSPRTGIEFWRPK